MWVGRLVFCAVGNVLQPSTHKQQARGNVQHGLHAPQLVVYCVLGHSCAVFQRLGINTTDEGGHWGRGSEGVKLAGQGRERGGYGGVLALLAMCFSTSNPPCNQLWFCTMSSMLIPRGVSMRKC